MPTACFHTKFKEILVNTILLSKPFVSALLSDLPIINYNDLIKSTLEVSSFKMTMSSSFKIAWAIEIHFTKYFCIPSPHGTK